MRILTSDFSNFDLVNLNINILKSAKEACGSKARFYQSEVNNGYNSQSNIDYMQYWLSEFRKWVPIVSAAKERDKKAQQEFDAMFI